MISIVVGLLLAFIIGLAVFRQTHAIWTMTSRNAATTNTTLNVLFGGNPVVEIVVMIVMILVVASLLFRTCAMGF
jgi:hypothetical protein